MFGKRFPAVIVVLDIFACKGDIAVLMEGSQMLIEQIDTDEVIRPRSVDAKIRQGYKTAVLIGRNIAVIIRFIRRKDKQGIDDDSQDYQ